MAGLGFKKHTLDNEASEAFKQCIQEQQVQYKLVPLGNHQRNQAEHMIQTFKAHFISILADIDNKFPLSLWCHLLIPTELTLNLLRQSKVAPKISAYAHVHGPHNYMKKPFAPLGCAIQAHIKPEDCRTWDTQSDAGFSIGTSMEHHRCFRVYITRTRATRISDTIFFKHQYIMNPTISPESHVVVAVQQLTITLQGNIPDGNKTAEALQKVSKLFTKIAMAKNELAKAKTMCNKVCANQVAHQAMHIPRVEAPIPRVETPHPRVTKSAEVHLTWAVTATQNKDRCEIMSATTPPVPRQIVQAPASGFKSPSCASLPNYISQDEDNNRAPMRQTTRLTAKSIMQEAMLSCVDINKPNYIVSANLGILNYTETPKPTGTTFTVTPQQMSQCKLPMKWLCKMANSVMGVNGEPLEYCHLIANQTTRAT